MADIITRLKMESGEYDSKIKRATQNLLAMENECRKTGRTLAVLEKDQKEYVQSLGSMQTVATTTRGKLGELTQAFTELTILYGRLTDEEKKGDIGRALSPSLDQLKTRINDTKAQLDGVKRSLGDIQDDAGGGGFKVLDGIKSVFGGNLLTKAAGMVGNLVSKVKDMVSEGLEMAKAGEGIRVAFDRLNRPDLLDKVREATHGTVNDIELMKAAVKFNDFRLPLDEMGTLLAFAQQKAKDTGQSVDYMVDSIVTGLGRQSLMILDNLGLSASEIKERMKQTGDMTKAVGAIIRDQMASAGGYVETAADRAAQADVKMQNALEKLGRTFQPIAEAGASMFNSIAVAAINALNKMRPFFDQFTQAGRIRHQMEEHGGTDRVNSEVNKLKAARTSGTGYYSTYMHRQNLQRYDDEINKIEFSIAANKDGKDSMSRGRVQKLNEELQAVKNLRAEYVKQSNMVFNPPKVNLPKADATGDKTKTKTDEKQQNQQRINALEQEYIKLGDLSTDQAISRQKAIQGEIAVLEKRNNLLKLREEQSHGILMPKASDFDTTGLMKGGSITTPATPKQMLLSDKAMKAVESNLIAPAFSDKGINEYLRKLKEQLSNLTIGSDQYEKINAQIVDVENIKAVISRAIKEGASIPVELPDLLHQIFEGADIDEEWKDIVAKLNKSLKENPLKLNVTTGEVENEGSEDESSRKKSTNPYLKENKDGKKEAKLNETLGGLGAGMQNVVGGLKELGIEIPEGLEKGIGVLTTISTILGGISSVVMAIAAIASADAIIPFAKGGIVPHAAGGFIIPGSDYSDRTPILAQSGELILNRAQQGNLVSQLEGGLSGNLQLSTSISAEQLRIILRNNGRRTGRGEYVTSKFKKS